MPSAVKKAIAHVLCLPDHPARIDTVRMRPETRGARPSWRGGPISLEYPNRRSDNRTDVGALGALLALGHVELDLLVLI